MHTQKKPYTHKKNLTHTKKPRYTQKNLIHTKKHKKTYIHTTLYTHKNASRCTHTQKTQVDAHTKNASRCTHKKRK